MSAIASQITGVSKKTSNFRVTVIYEGNSPVTGEFPTQRASNAAHLMASWSTAFAQLLCFIACFLWITARLVSRWYLGNQIKLDSLNLQINVQEITNIFQCGLELWHPQPNLPEPMMHPWTYLIWRAVFEFKHTDEHAGQHFIEFCQVIKHAH